MTSTRYYQESEIITGLDPDPNIEYWIREVGKQSLLNSGYTVLEESSYKDTDPSIREWTLTVTNTRYRNGTTTGDGGGSSSRLTRDGGGSSGLTTITDSTVPLTTITDTDIPLTTIPNSPIPLANLPITGRKVAAMLGSVGLVLLGIALKTRKKYDE